MVAAAVTAPDVFAIDLHRRMAVLDTGEEIPIISMFDRWGDETDHEAEVVSLCIGPDAEGNWYAAAVSEFKGRPN